MFYTKFELILNWFMRITLLVAAFLYIFDVLDFEAFAFLALLWGAGTIIDVELRQIDIARKGKVE